jgi:ribose transport system permease protein
MTGTARRVSTDTAQRPAPRSAPPRRPSVLLSAQHIGLVLAASLLVAIVLLYLVLFGAQKSALPGNFELTTTVNNAVPLVFAALGQAFTVLTGGLDLSVGGVMDVTNSIAASQMHDSAGSILLWSLVILAFGAAVGLINGLLVAYGRLQPIIVTLGTLAILQGIALKVLPQPGGAVPAGVTNTLVNPNAPSGLVMVAIAGVIWFVLRRTRFGVGVYALGNDRLAARSSGVPVLRVIVLTYVTSGVLAAAAGLLLAATTTGGDPTSGDVFTLTSIAAVVIGGISLAGGRGNGIGAILGALVLTILINVLFFAHIDPLYEPLYEGLFLVLATALTVLLGTVVRRAAAARTASRHQVRTSERRPG